LVIAVHVGIAQLGKLVSLVNIAARDGARLGMVMLDHGGDKWSRTPLAVGVERVGTFHHAPTMIASAADQFDHLPEILTHIPDPGLSRVRIETEAPWISEAVGPNLGARALHS